MAEDRATTDVGETPRVSVIIPCYNLGQYLDEAVESVLSQTYQDFEILIVDDGSTDPATQALLADYRRPKTRVMRTTHGGLAAARNLAIANTAGAYLCALDADDRLEPWYLERVVPILDADPSVAFASCWLRTFGEEDWEWKPERAIYRRCSGRTRSSPPRSCDGRRFSTRAATTRRCPCRATRTGTSG